MGNAAVVARRLHPVVSTQRFVARGRIAAHFLLEVAKRCRQAVGAMLVRLATECAKRVLQTFS
jgi:hypothetical protein